MAETTLIARTNVGQIYSPGIFAVTFDATVRETHAVSVTVTDHPVEQGANISDHARAEPEKVELEVIISNTPLSTDQVTRAIRKGSATIQSRTRTSAPFGIQGRAKQAYDDLKRMADEGIIVTIVTGLKRYDSMILESFNVPRDAKNSEALHFTATFKKIRVVNNKLTALKVKAPNRVKAEVDTGHQTPKQDPIEKSTAATMLDGFTGADGHGGGPLGGVKALFNK